MRFRCQVTLEVYFIGLVAFAPHTWDTGTKSGFVAVLPDAYLTKTHIYYPGNEKIPQHIPFFAYRSNRPTGTTELEAVLAFLKVDEPEGEYFGAYILNDEEIHLDSGSNKSFSDEPLQGLPNGTNVSNFKWVPRMEDFLDSPSMHTSVKSGIDSRGLIKGRFRSDYGDGLTTVGHATREIMPGLLRLRSYVFEHANGYGFHSQAMADITRLDLLITGTPDGSGNCMIDIELKRFGYQAGDAKNRSVTLYAGSDRKLQALIANIPPSDTPKPEDELVRHFQVYYTLLENPPLWPRHVPYASPFLNLEGHVETKPVIVESLLRRLETTADSKASEIRHYPWDILACPGVRFN